MCPPPPGGEDIYNYKQHTDNLIEKNLLMENVDFELSPNQKLVTKMKMHSQIELTDDRLLECNPDSIPEQSQEPKPEKIKNQNTTRQKDKNATRKKRDKPKSTKTN